ncbi:hypothetical protein QAD02_007350 [Eretmocerus hayati]|uniref:Uncharacterized protein n=1 Tax=Eretmocerus hayati TaxID=131215 RepID=A0ACC2N4P8_9HYME|nr:hypothetical protein QAD02_007350 [Eretmocerus hayati]
MDKFGSGTNWEANPSRQANHGKEIKGERERVEMRILAWNIAGTKTLTSSRQWEDLGGFEEICSAEEVEKRGEEEQWWHTSATKDNPRAKTLVLSQEMVKSEIQIGKEKWKIILTFMDHEKYHYWRRTSKKGGDCTRNGS